MDPKPGWQTTEFWLALIAKLVPLAVLFKWIPEGDAKTLEEALVQIVTHLALVVGAAAVVWKYIASRAVIKSSAVSRVPPLLLIGILFCGSAFAQQATLLDISALKPGKYMLTIVPDGTVTVQSARVVTPNVGPSPQPDPTPGPTLTPRAKELRDLAAAVTGDPKRDETAVELQALYSEIAKKARTGEIGSVSDLAFVAKNAAGMLLDRKGVSPFWQPVRDKITSHWNLMLNEGRTLADHANYLDEAAAGIGASSSRANTAIDLTKILEIIRLILELLERFKTEAAAAVGLTAPAQPAPGGSLR